MKLSVYILILLLAVSAAVHAQHCLGREPVFFGGTIKCSEAPYKLVFYDEFDGNHIDTTKWYTYWPVWPAMDDQSLFSRTHDVETGPNAFKELQIFKDENVIVSDGTVKLRAKRDTSTWFGVEKKFSSGWLQSREYYKYGKFEIRFKLPAGTGLWSAIWLWGAGDSPSGTNETHEVDMIEYCGEEPSKHHITYHYKNNTTDCKATQSPYVFNTANLSADYHILTCDITPQYIKIYCDGALVRFEPVIRTIDNHLTTCGENLAYGTYLFSNFIPNVGQNLILNLSLSNTNSYCEAVNADTPFPSLFEIDYVKIWQRAVDEVDKIIVYPNPANQFMYASYESTRSKISRYLIQDLNGNIQSCPLATNNGKEMAFDISNLNPGIYVLTMTSESRTYKNIFIKAKN
jgi:hypothetical protein